MAESDDRHDEDDGRSGASRDRVDERQLGLPVGSREQREVGELQQRGDDDERPDGPFGVEPESRHGREHDHRREKRHGGRALGVSGASEEDVPESVQNGGREREGERERRHRTSRVGFRAGWEQHGHSCSTSTGRSRTTSPSCSAIYQWLFARHGRPLTEEQYYGRLAGLSEEAIIGGWLGVDGPLLATLVAERVERYAAEAADGRTVTEPLREALRYAATRVPVAIVSGAFRAEIEPVVEAAGIAGDSTTIVAADDVKQGKPHPEGYLRALERLGVDPARRRRIRGHRGRSRIGEGRRVALPRRSRHAARRAARRRRRARRPDRRRPRRRLVG